MTTTTRQFEMWGQPAEIIVRVKHENGTTIDVPVSDVTQYICKRNSFGDISEIRIPMHGEWFNKLVETTDFSSYRKGF